MTNCLYAESVSEEKANQVAVNFLQSTTGLVGLRATLNFKQIEPNGTIDFYVFNFHSTNAFVIVTGNDILQPVIAYSTESAFDISDVKQFGVSDWISDVQKQIGEALKSNVKAEPRITELWSAYMSGSPIIMPQAAAVTPLLTTTWDQSQDIGGSPHYNSLCPFNNFKNARSVTGCVATAMAQIMKYWNQPAVGAGSHSYNCVNSLSGYIYGVQSANFGTTTYDWANMPNSVSATSTNAIDILMYHCGVAVEMDYGVNILPEKGSSSITIGSSPSALAAYVNYFGYRNTIQGVYASNYTSLAWINLLKSELDANRPMQYRGEGPSGGHSWVCDGYDVNGMMHMNWGWGGSNNGYYNVANLNPSSTNFNTDQGAIIGIWPGNLSNCNANYSLSGNQTQSYTWQAYDFITSSITIQSNLQTIYSAANQVILTPGFIANLNTNFLATIQPCITYRLGNSNSSEALLSEESNKLSIFPNPGSSFITIKISDASSKTKFKIYNSTMQLIKALDFESGIENYLSISDLNNGIYFIDAQTDEQSYRAKFVVSR